MQPHDKASQTFDGIVSVITNKRSRSLLFLILTAILIITANGLLPLISGQAHYTAEIKEVTYNEYQHLKENNQLYDLTYGAEAKIRLYKAAYKINYPDITPEEEALLEPPLDMKLNIYTKFFFQSPWWYIDTLISVVSAVFLFYALFNYFITRDKDTKEDHINGERTIKQLNESYLDPDTFEPWIEEKFNRERKIKQHIANIKYKIKRLETKTDFKIRRRFKDYFNNQVEVPMDNLLPVRYTKTSKKERKYLEKKEDLLLKLDEKYINEYVVDSNVKHFKSIRPGFVYSGVNIEGVTQDEYSTIKSDTQKIKGSLISKILLSLSVTVTFASLLTIVAINAAEQDPLWVVITIIMKIVPLTLQVYFAINYTNEFMYSHLLPNLKFRENIAMRYLAEMKREGKMDRPIVINKINIVGKEHQNA